MAGEGSASGGVSGFKFDMKRLTQVDKIIGVATLVFFISLFLDWFGYSFAVYSVSVDGLWHGYMYIPLLISLAIFAYLVARAGFDQMPVKLPLPEAQVLVIATAINFVLTFISFITKPGGSSWQFGAYIGLIASFVAVAPRLVPALMSARKSPASGPKQDA